MSVSPSILCMQPIRLVDGYTPAVGGTDVLFFEPKRTFTVLLLRCALPQAVLGIVGALDDTTEGTASV